MNRPFFEKSKKYFFLLNIEKYRKVPADIF